MPEIHGSRWRKRALLRIRGCGQTERSPVVTAEEAGLWLSPSAPNPPTRYTEADGWLATWRHDRGRIRILQVRLSSGVPLELCTGAYIPDLAEMRERFPEHAGLWDAIRHEFWAALVPESHTG